MQRNHRGVIASYKASFMPPTNRRATFGQRSFCQDCEAEHFINFLVDAPVFREVFIHFLAEPVNVADPILRDTFTEKLQLTERSIGAFSDVRYRIIAIFGQLRDYSGVFAVALELAVVLDLLRRFYRIRVDLYDGYAMRSAPGSEAKPVMACRFQCQNNLRLIVLCRDFDHPVMGSLKAFLVVFEGKWLVCESSTLSINSTDKVFNAPDIAADDQ